MEEIDFGIVMLVKPLHSLKVYGSIVVKESGSLTCFTAIFISSFALLHNTALSFIAALTGTLIEGLPLKDFDNLCIPVVLGGLSQFLFPHV